MNAKMLSGVVIAMAVVTATAYAGGPAHLNEEQEAEKAVFDKAMKEPLQSLKDRCGIEVPLTVDFENYSKDGWLEADLAVELRDSGNVTAEEREDAKKRLRVMPPENNCITAVQSIARACRIDDGYSKEDHDRRRSTSHPLPELVESKWRAAIAQELKGIACLFTGYSPERKGKDRATSDSLDSYLARNMTYAKGVYTLHNHPRLANVDAVTWDAVRAGIETSSAAPRVELPPRGRRNGQPCDSIGQCSSFACVKHVCQPCGHQVGCARNATCMSGTCYANRSADDAAPSSPSVSHGHGSAAPAGKGLGQLCNSGSDCRSGKCKRQSPTRSTCQ